MYLQDVNARYNVNVYLKLRNHLTTKSPEIM